MPDEILEVEVPEYLVIDDGEMLIVYDVEVELLEVAVQGVPGPPGASGYISSVAGRIFAMMGS